MARRLLLALCLVAPVALSPAPAAGGTAGDLTLGEFVVPEDVMCDINRQWTTMQAAGIITHIWIDPLMRDGLGIMAGTRATAIGGTLANGQIVPYPVPAPGLP